MNERDEQRVIEALRALTGGLTVTEQDIITAHGRLKDSLEPPSPRRRRLALVAAAAAAVLAVGFVVSQTIDRDGDAAPPAGTPTSPADILKTALQADAYALPSAEFTAGARPTTQDLAGFWLLRPPFDFTMVVDANGGWRMGAPMERLVYGTSTLAGDTWTRRLDDRSGCAQSSDLVGFSQSWRAALADDGSLRLRFTGSENICTPADDREVWDRVAPGSTVADYLLTMAGEAQWQSASGRFGWQGLYVAPETGHVLEVSNDGQYRYYDTLTGNRWSPPTGARSSPPTGR